MDDNPPVPSARLDRLRRRAARAIDASLDLLMRPGVRRVRRWAFLVTVPVAVLVAGVVDPRSGALVIAVRVGLWLAIAIVAWRVGGERGQAVLDLLMHPRARALMRVETDVVLALPRLLWGALVTRPARALRYSGGDQRPARARRQPAARRSLTAAPTREAPGDGRTALSALGGLELAGGLRDALTPA